MEVEKERVVGGIMKEWGSNEGLGSLNGLILKDSNRVGSSTTH